MSETARFNLPLLASAQAQKHVTVNEALARLDGLTQLTLQSVNVNTPPTAATEGTAYGVGAAPVNAWAGQGGQIALYVNGGWVFCPPALGMRAYIADENGWASFDGTGWVSGLLTLSAHGAGMVSRVLEYDHDLTHGASSELPFALPGDAIVYGVTGRVITEITGTLSGFSVGVSSSTNRYGSGLSLTQNSWLRGMTGTPMTYYAPESLILTAEGGDFAGGSVRLAVHFAQLSLPSL